MNDYDRDNCKNYDFYYDEHIYRNGKGQGTRKGVENLSFLLAIIYLFLCGLGLLVAIFCPPIGALIILAAQMLRDSA